jgi:DNA-binding NarL/FixJ family response regulator
MHTGDDMGAPDSSPRMAVPKDAEAISCRKSRILLVEDHPMLREHLAQLINRNADMEVCGEADGAEGALELIRDRAPDLAIVDLTLRRSSGMDLLKEIKEQKAMVPVLVLSMHDEAVYAERCLQMGARGYVPKSELSSEVMRAVRKVLGGEVYLNEWMTSELIQRAAVRSEEPRVATIAALSEREFKVLQLIAHGCDTHEMARELGLSESVIATLRLRIKRRMGAKDMPELYHRATEWMLEVEKRGQPSTAR